MTGDGGVAAHLCGVLACSCGRDGEVEVSMCGMTFAVVVVVDFVGVAARLKADGQKCDERARVARIFEGCLRMLAVVRVFKLNSACAPEPVLQISLLAVKLMRTAKRYHFASS